MSEEHFKWMQHQYRSRAYNSIVEDGKVVTEGTRPSKKRYEAIKDFCLNLGQTVSVLDIGAAEGYFTLMLAHDFPNGVFVAVESDDCRGLKDRCESKSNVCLIQEEWTVDSIKQMQDVRRFDVILALSVVHHFSDPFQEVLDELMGLCTYCFFEHPNPNEGERTNNITRVRNEPLDLSAYEAVEVMKTDCTHLDYGKELSRDLLLLKTDREGA